PGQPAPPPGGPPPPAKGPPPPAPPLAKGPSPVASPSPPRGGDGPQWTDSESEAPGEASVLVTGLGSRAKAHSPEAKSHAVTPMTAMGNRSPMMEANVTSFHAGEASMVSMSSVEGPVTGGWGMGGTAINVARPTLQAAALAAPAVAIEETTPMNQSMGSGIKAFSPTSMSSADSPASFHGPGRATIPKPFARPLQEDDDLEEESM
ncbi:unnamed protein product, partial [Polarella glacialis]